MGSYYIVLYNELQHLSDISLHSSGNDTDTLYSRIQLHIKAMFILCVGEIWCAMKVCDYFWCQQDRGCVDMCSMCNKNTSTCFIHVMRPSRKSCVQNINRYKSRVNSLNFFLQPRYLSNHLHSVLIHDLPSHFATYSIHAFQECNEQRGQVLTLICNSPSLP